MTTLKYVEPAQMGSGEDPKLVTTTIQEYDNSQLSQAYRSQLMGVGMMAFMHVYMKYTNPLLIQSMIPLKGVFESNLIKVHLFSNPAVGELKRPWKAAGGMMGMGAGEVKSDKASVGKLHISNLFQAFLTVCRSSRACRPWRSQGGVNFLRVNISMSTSFACMYAAISNRPPRKSKHLIHAVLSNLCVVTLHF